MEQVEVSQLLTENGSFITEKQLLQKYGNGQTIGDTFRDTWGWKTYEYLTGNFQPDAGYHTDFKTHSNILRTRMNDLLASSLSDFDSSTIIRHCKINKKQVSMINIMDEICPENQKLESKTKRDADISEYNQCDDLGDNYESILNGIRNLIRKMEKEEKPEFLIDGIIPIFNLSATDLKKLSSISSLKDVAVLPKETQKIIFRVFTVLSTEGISLSVSLR